MQELRAAEREAVAGRSADELDIFENPVDRGDDHFLGIGEAVDQQQREHVVLEDVVRLQAQLRLEAPGGLRCPLHAELVDVENEFAVDLEAVAGEADGKDAALHHAGRPDLAGRCASRHRHAGKGLGEPMIEGGRIVIGGEEDDEVLEVGAAQPGS